MRAIKDYQDQYVLDDKEKAILDADTIEFGYDPYEMMTNLVSTPVVAYIKKYFESHKSATRPSSYKWSNIFRKNFNPIYNFKIYSKFTNKYNDYRRPH